MVKLTPELILQSAQFINPVRDRELDLRGYKIPVIENLGATLDQFDTIDLSDNDIRKVDGFPYLKRLKHVFLNNNNVVRIAEGLEENIPYLESLILTNNQMQELCDLDSLVSLKRLETLSLLKNPVTSKPHYRLYIIYKLPQIKVLDFRKIKMKEREEANKLFKSKKGKQLEKDLSRKAKTFVPGGAVKEVNNKPSGPTPQDIQAIREAIAKASSLEEIERLNILLKSGQVPNRQTLRPKASEVEEDDDDNMDTTEAHVNGK